MNNSRGGAKKRARKGDRTAVVSSQGGREYQQGRRGKKIIGGAPEQNNFIEIKGETRKGARAQSRERQGKYTLLGRQEA